MGNKKQQKAYQQGLNSAWHTGEKKYLQNVRQFK